MLKRMLSLGTACLLISSTCPAPLAASTQAQDEQELAQRIKAKVEKIGSGPKARVEVKLRDGSKVKGHISEVHADHFVVTNETTGGVTTITYAEARQVKTRGENPVKDAKVWLGIALIPALLGFAVWAKDRD